MTDLPKSIEPLVISVADAARVIGLSRSELYRQLGAGRIRAVKHGTRILIPMEVLRSYITALPEARITTRT